MQCKLQNFKCQNDPRTVTVRTAPKSCYVHWVSLYSVYTATVKSIRFEALKAITLTKTFLVYQPPRSWVEIQHSETCSEPFVRVDVLTMMMATERVFRVLLLTQLWSSWKPKYRYGMSTYVGQKPIPILSNNAVPSEWVINNVSCWWM
jgi:hypothetical protein